MASIAVRNLFHDKLRLFVTLTGIIFSVVLVSVQVGLLLGFIETISNVIKNSNADLWVMSRDVRYLEVAAQFPDKKLYDVLAIPGVQEAQRLIFDFAGWKRPDGAVENIEIIGINPNSSLGAPWNLVEGSEADLKLPDSVIIDKFYAEKLGVERLGQSFEIRDRRARVVGFTSGIRTFTTAATVYTSLRNARGFTDTPENRIHYILVRCARGVSVEQVRKSIRSRLRDVDVLTTDEFADRTVNYWMFSTGAGVTVIIAAVLGVIVGVVVVAQTIYSATVDHIREFGTLKAIGASNRFIYRILFEQATISAVLGYAVGITIAYIAIHAAAEGAPMLLPVPVAFAMFILTLLMCFSAALISVNKVTRIDPAMVFKG